MAYLSSTDWFASREYETVPPFTLRLGRIVSVTPPRVVTRLDRCDPRTSCNTLIEPKSQRCTFARINATGPSRALDGLVAFILAACTYGLNMMPVKNRES